MTWKKGMFYVLLPVFVFVFSVYVTIDILLRAGDTVVCPDVRGKTVEEAKAIAGKKGLPLVVLRYENRNDVPYNHVTLQKPEANISIRKGRVVHVIVSEGPKLTEVPNLSGKTIQEAEEILRDKNLEPGRIVRIPHPRDGRVIAQNPKAGERTLERKGVDLFLGQDTGRYFIIPDGKDMTLWDLQDELDAKGIKYRVTELPKTDKLAGAGVLRISIPPRTVFRSDQEIAIFINSGG